MSVIDPPGVAVASWQSRALYWMIQPLLDESGHLECPEQILMKHLSTLTGMPVETVMSSVVELCGNSVLIVDSTGIKDQFFLSRNDQLSSSVETDENKKKKKNKNNNHNNGGDEAPRRPGRPPSDPRHHPAIAAWFRQHELTRGEKYVMHQKKDGMAVKRLLEKIPDATIEDIEQRMKVALADPWFQKAGDLSIFCSKWNNYAPRSSFASPNDTTRAMMRPLGAPPGEM